MLDNSYWTLAVELIFYLLILIAYITKQIKKVDLLIVGGLLLLASFHLALKITQSDFFTKISGRIEFVNHAQLFFVGILFYKLQNDANNVKRHLLIFICLVFAIMLHSKSHVANYISQFEHGCVLVGIFSIFYLFIYGKLNWVVNKTTLFFGKISYSVYLVHQFFSSKVLVPFFASKLGLPILPTYILSFIIVVGLAILLCHFIEIPVNNAIRQRYKKKHIPIVRHEREINVAEMLN